MELLTSVNNLAVIGAGQMGTGIALVGNRVAGLPVKLIDTTDEALSRSQKFAGNSHVTFRVMVRQGNQEGKVEQ